MDISERSYNSPYRIWRCPACGDPSGRAGHINAECASANPVEYVRANTLSGAVSAERELLRDARDYLAKYAADTLLGADVLVNRIDAALESPPAQGAVDPSEHRESMIRAAREALDRHEHEHADNDGRALAVVLALEAYVGQHVDRLADGAYIECIPAQEAAYWEARKRGLAINDHDIGALLRVAAPHLRGDVAAAAPRGPEPCAACGTSDDQYTFCHAHSWHRNG